MANAGSGKTYVLSRRVVRLLLEGAKPESIVCLTYTKAAAAEMRDRILKLLKSLTISTDALNDILGEAPTQSQIALAPKLLDTVLDSPLGGMTITTIHGFCQQLLGSFPIEAGISPHAILLDDREQYELMQTAIHRLYANDDAPIQESLAFITEIAAEARLGDWLTAIIRQRRDWAGLNHSTAILEEIKASHPMLASYDRSYWLTQILSGFTADTEAALKEALPKLKDTERFMQWLTNRIDIESCMLAWLTEKRTPRKTLLNPLKDTHLYAPLQREQERIYEIHKAIATVSAIEESYHMAILADAILQLYAQLKVTKNALDYDDLIDAVERLFARELPWVMTKLDYRIDHLLLDEAQDTSPAQWRITEALVKELLAADAPSGQQRSLFVVGDDKQSIYSFQGAAPEMFEAMREDWKQSASIESYTLSTSYRSAEPILQLANSICGVEHTLHRKGMAGRVELWPIIDQPAKADKTPYAVPESQSDEERAQSLLALQIAGTIKNWFEEKRELKARGRAVSAGDIMILVHRRKPMTPLLIRELQKLEIPVAGIDRLTLSSHLAVKDFIALMRWLYAPEDDLALAQVLRSPLIGLTETQLYELAQGREQATLWQRVQDNAQLRAWRNLRNLTPYDFLHRILEIEGKRIAYVARFGLEVHEVLDELLHHAALTEGEAISLLAYAEQLERAAKEIKREHAGASGRDEVRIMTVHGAKGLESPIVILADTTNPPDLRKELWFKTDAMALPLVTISDDAKLVEMREPLKEARREALQREYERLLYVAITRAEDELYIGGVQPASNRKVGENSWYAICKSALQNISSTIEKDGTYVLESKQTAPVKTETNTHAHHEGAAPAWAKKPAPKEVRPGAFLPSRLVNSELALYESRDGDARQRGVIIHQLLELGSVNPNEATLSKLANFIAPDWKAKDREAMVRDVYALLRNPDLSWLWSSKGYNEVSIAGPLTISGESKWMNGQIDRLVMQGNQIVILDYKTSANLPKNAAETTLAYLLQMKAYRELLANKYKGKTIRAALLWTHAPRLDWLDEQLDTISWDEMRQAA